MTEENSVRKFEGSRKEEEQSRAKERGEKTYLGP
jgi:hypothetical protein